MTDVNSGLRDFLLFSLQLVKVTVLLFLASIVPMSSKWWFKTLFPFMCHFSHARVSVWFWFSAVYLWLSLYLSHLGFLSSRIYTFSPFPPYWEISVMISWHTSSFLVFPSFCDSNYTCARPSDVVHVSLRHCSCFVLFLSLLHVYNFYWFTFKLTDSPFCYLHSVVKPVWWIFLFQIFYFSVLGFPLDSFHKFYSLLRFPKFSFIIFSFTSLSTIIIVTLKT